MIQRNDVFPIGKLVKPHGIKGEVSFAFTSDVFDRTESPYWFFDMDGILVPFFLESIRFKSNETALVKFEGLDSEVQIRRLCGKEVFYPVRYAGEEQSSPDDWTFYVGFHVFDEVAGYLGEIKAVDDSTLNVLFVLNKDGQEMLLPVAEEYFTNVDTDKREMRVSLPEGLIGL
jgi:16S rRNA processing protein RimM